MLFKVSNEGRGPRFVKNKRILPGQEPQSLDLDAGTARGLHRLSKRGGSIKIAATNDEGQKILDASPEKKKSKTSANQRMYMTDRPVRDPYQEQHERRQSQKSDQDDDGDAADDNSDSSDAGEKTAKQELAERAPDMQVKALRAEAAMVLGKDAPNNLHHMNKPTILKLLEE